jgi:hypothetical protein
LGLLCLLLGIISCWLPGDDASAEPGVVWLTFESETPEQMIHFMAPLEWLGGSSWGEDRTVEIDGLKVDLVSLWEKYRSLPAGKQIEIEKGRTNDGTPYVLHVLSKPPSEKVAEGKVHILARDDNGEVIDLRFPLNIPALVIRLLFSLPIFGSEDQFDGDSAVDRYPPLKELQKLGGYGPFLLVEVIQEQPQLKITVE